MTLGDVDDTLKGMIVNEAIDAQGLVDIAPTMMGREITLKEAEQIVEKIIEENC